MANYPDVPNKRVSFLVEADTGVIRFALTDDDGGWEWGRGSCPPDWLDALIAALGQVRDDPTVTAVISVRGVGMVTAAGA